MIQLAELEIQMCHYDPHQGQICNYGVIKMLRLQSGIKDNHFSITEKSSLS